MSRKATIFCSIFVAAVHFFGCAWLYNSWSKDFQIYILQFAHQKGIEVHEIFNRSYPGYRPPEPPRILNVLLFPIQSISAVNNGGEATMLAKVAQSSLWGLMISFWLGPIFRRKEVTSGKTAGEA